MAPFQPPSATSGGKAQRMFKLLHTRTGTSSRRAIQALSFIIFFLSITILYLAGRHGTIDGRDSLLPEWLRIEAFLEAASDSDLPAGVGDSGRPSVGGVPDFTPLDTVVPSTLHSTTANKTPYTSPAFDYLKGQWEFDPTGSQPFKVYPAVVGPEEGETLKEHARRAKKRAEEMSKWVWKPSEAYPDNWEYLDSFKLLERLVKSRMGMLVVGDSLSGQQFNLIRKRFEQVPIPGSANETVNILRKPTAEEEARWSPLMHFDQEGKTHPYFFEPAAAKLLFPKLDPARLALPIYAYVRADFILHVEEVSDFLGDGYAVANRKEKHAEGWREWISLWYGKGDPLQEGEERGVVVFNTGAHWTARGVMGGGTPNEETERLSRAYALTADRVLEFFAPFVAQLHIVYRTIAPGHPNCSDSPGQVVPALPVEAPGMPWPKYGWDRFEALDGIWREKVRAVNRLGWKVDMLEIREQALARGDAHLRPHKGDCLHWALPFVPWHWNAALNYLIMS